MNEADTKLQNQIKAIQDQNLQLARRNDGLENQIKEYGELFMSEKEEKKERQGKAELLQGTLTTRIDQFNQEKTHRYRKYYTLRGLCLCLVIAILGLLLYS